MPNYILSIMRISEIVQLRNDFIPIDFGLKFSYIMNPKKGIKCP